MGSRATSPESLRREGSGGSVSRGRGSGGSTPGSRTGSPGPGQVTSMDMSRISSALSDVSVGT